MAEVEALRLAGLGVGLVGVAAAVVGAMRGRGDRPLAPLPLLLGVAGLAVSAALAVLLPPMSYHPTVLWTLGLGGIVAGILAAAAVRVRREPGGVVARGGAWHLLPAALALLALQAAGLAGSLDALVVATAAVLASVAFAAGAVGAVVLRGLVARPHPATALPTAAAPAGVPALPARAAAAPPVVAVPPVASASVRIACGSCGAPVRTGWRHCVGCGAGLAWG